MRRSNIQKKSRILFLILLSVFLFSACHSENQSGLGSGTSGSGIQEGISVPPEQAAEQSREQSAHIDTGNPAGTNSNQNNNSNTISSFPIETDITSVIQENSSSGTNTKVIERNGDITIALVPKSLDNSIFLDAKEESERVARELGIRTEWLGPMQADADEQVNIVESLIRRKVDGILISCLDADKMKPVIDKAVAAGIKVATFDSDSPDSDRLFYCGTDNTAAGAACAEAMINALKAKNKLGWRLKLLVMTADEESFNLNERLDSFLKTAKMEGVDLDVIDTLYCRNDVNLAGEMLEIYMKAGNDVDVFFSTGGWPLMGPYESMPYFQRWCKNGGTSIVMDTYYSIVSSAKNGLADGLVGQNFRKMGELSTLALYKVIKGERMPDRFIDTGLELGNKDNYDKLLQNIVPWETE